MRNWFILAMTSVVAVAISMPASAAKKKPAVLTVSNFEACEQKAIELGMPHGQAGHNEYVRECMGRRPGNSHPPL